MFLVSLLNTPVTSALNEYVLALHALALGGVTDLRGTLSLLPESPTHRALKPRYKASLFSTILDKSAAQTDDEFRLALTTEGNGFTFEGRRGVMI
jgi:hypothetical protein